MFSKNRFFPVSKVVKFCVSVNTVTIENQLKFIHNRLFVLLCMLWDFSGEQYVLEECSLAKW